MGAFSLLRGEHEKFDTQSPGPTMHLSFEVVFRDMYNDTYFLRA